MNTVRAKEKYYKITLRSGAVIDDPNNKFVGYHSSGMMLSFLEQEEDKIPNMVVPTANISMVEYIKEEKK